jgi:hypothetical protein
MILLASTISDVSLKVYDLLGREVAVLAGAPRAFPDCYNASSCE